MTNLFPDVRPISNVAMNILKKRYFSEGETTWDDVANRVTNFVLDNADEEQKETTRQMILNRYFIPNSPCLVNAGKPNTGLCACFVVDFPDTIEGIYKTKLDFALIARKGGGCGTTLTKIRPEGSKVSGSTHGYAGGPIKFADTISHDAQALTQAGFRAMAIMLTMSIYHPDILKFISAKEEEGKISNANISVVVDDAFMQKVENDETYWTEFGGIKYQEYKARDVFNMIVEGAWRNGEPGVLFKTRFDDSPYKYTNQEILSTNPCSRLFGSR
jgi:ribonucleoside-diphosphate reductase alpha chain